MTIPLAWPSFRDAYITPGVPSVHGASTGAGGQLFVDSGGQRIGLLLPIPTCEVELPRSGRALSIRKIARGGVHHAELSTSSEPLFESFFGLASQIIRGVEAGDSTALVLCREIQAWRELLRDAGRMSAPQEIGLWGELRVLEVLLERYGPGALDAWGGPLGDLHDFRMGGIELEAKTTVGALRRHTISSLQQLVPSDAHRLFVVSQLIVEEPAPVGRTLPGMVDSIISRLRVDLLDQFAERLASAGYASSDAGLFTRGYVLRSEARLVDVLAELPRITRFAVDAMLGVEQSRRVVSLTYQLDMDGLGHSFDGRLPL